MFDHKRHLENKMLDTLAEGKFDRMAEVLPDGQQGVAKIDRFTIGPRDMLSSLADYGEDYVPEGTYARLKVDGVLMMTDTPMERRTNLEIIAKARGRVLIAGLGLGMILRTLLKKPEVSHITVLERYQDVVDLVMPSLIAFLAQWDRDDFPPRLEVIRADVFQWEPPTDLAKFHTIYFDIWPASKVRHLPEMHLLHKRYRPLLAKGGWMSSWTYDKLRKREKDDADFLRQLPAQLEDGWRRNTREYSIQAIHLMLGVDPEVISDTEKRVIREWALAKGIDV